MDRRRLILKHFSLLVAGELAVLCFSTPTWGQWQQAGRLLAGKGT
jgi:hypothetical protein